ncbi:bifunctional 3-(3-hydroxy-phenyl)propionate/3-hydroxycinnamic acid hydroxylase [Pluralibacter gergoviae]|uniref:Bifunctional 3-(3-hydroxy-phenyl)propionate/3-hydroxycinnamic acid hydroxylase n=1 Tax=Pluralibacter gergoviae TaxID=61647 RepID=A0AAI9DMV3_PLUGE|nr:bifunctional 3-(3-hydroxy-phenyl)propionate/3-hydroxycinnamic acid hydroxylase [Pluralibacter gergoviae]EKV0916572.1 bifunctional 3-(3-hydroxy-phenyl)propionate/3-hydroxycinnamic acid hydroxylase [Pluralibacter gergoviae]EKV9908791.1 bifunctional 3-(3-hydroxy-phenyl)propionate/3-hydroxycinnamic acid hydroxylase [Pluralibacter gergoviae]EKW7274641.1 bifunctional 3-(3-hydroxy-phenyl)propionate/3-hydroxycinnamic acid hydroxylase [Pluralibacter gergoviae]ELD4298124.1 bifunctional 3-(3-hydroxy-ph
MNNNTMYDIAIVGYGPVGQLLSLVMGRQGYRVAVFERWESLYPLPRAVFHDHEIRRVLRMLDLEQEVAPVSHAASSYEWYSADWRRLLALDWGAESISGGPFGYFFNQPDLEAIFDRQVKALPNVDRYPGREVERLSQTADGCELVMVATAERDDPAAERQRFQARYVIGADGANSTVRRTCGIDWLDLGFAEDWLVADVRPRPGVTLDIPESAQWCNPERPTTIVPGGPGYRRWEFMRLPHESMADLQSEEKVWQLLAPWATPESVELVRHAVYQFRSRIADRWRQGRVLLAGDAAHLMPPFMGQGMCSGLRDVWNLSWRLDRVLRGRAGEALLDGYAAERRPQIRAVIEDSIAMGRVVCVSDMQQALARDNRYLSGEAGPLPPFPGLQGGLLYPAQNGLSGQLFVHGALRRGARDGRFDDLFGRGFHLILAQAAAAPTLLALARPLMEELGGQVVIIGDGRGESWQDLSGKYAAFLREQRVCAALMRPDFYLYGAVARADEVPALLRHLRDSLSLTQTAAVS